MEDVIPVKFLTVNKEADLNRQPLLFIASSIPVPFGQWLTSINYFNLLFLKTHFPGEVTGEFGYTHLVSSGVRIPYLNCRSHSMNDIIHDFAQLIITLLYFFFSPYKTMIPNNKCYTLNLPTIASSPSDNLDRDSAEAETSSIDAVCSSVAAATFCTPADTSSIAATTL